MWPRLVVAHSVRALALARTVRVNSLLQARQLGLLLFPHTRIQAFLLAAASLKACTAVLPSILALNMSSQQKAMCIRCAASYKQEYTAHSSSKLRYHNAGTYLP